MKRLFLLNYFFLLVVLVTGQNKSNNVDISWGKKQSVSKRTTISEVVGSENGNIYVLKSTFRGLLGVRYTLESYDYSMNLIKSTELKLEEEGKDLDFNAAALFNGKLYLFTSFKNQKLKKRLLFVQTINKTTLEPNKDIRKIAEVDYANFSRYNSGAFSYSVSRDTSKLLVYYDMPYDDDKHEKFGYQVYDRDFNLLWSKDIELPYTDELFEIEEHDVDNDGSVFILGKLYKEKKKDKRKGAPNYNYRILAYLDMGAESREYTVEFPGKFLTDMKMAITNQRDIICSGFYSNEGTYSIKGSYFFKIDRSTKEIIAKSFNEFSVDFITQYMKESKANKTKKKAAKGDDVEMYNYVLNDIIIRNDGGAALIGEQYHVRAVTTTTSTSNGGTTTTTTYYYYYDDIIVVNIAPDGNIDWTEKIHKTQHTVNDNGYLSSYAVAVVKDKLYFIFNDNPKNINYNGKGTMYDYHGGKNSMIVMVTMDNTGKQSREMLFSFSEAGVYILPKYGEQISEKELFLFGNNKKTQRLAKLTFK